MTTIVSFAAEQSHVCRYCAAPNKAAWDEQYHERKYAPPRLVDVLHLKLDVTPDFQKRTVAGTVTIEFAPLGKPLKSLRLDAVDLEIFAVKASAAVVDHTAAREELTITFAEPIAVGQRTQVEIDYRAEPRQGLYFRTAELGYAAEETHLFTQGEPQKSRHWFPSCDSPNERCSTEILCTVPADMTVLSNGVLVSETVQQRRKTVHWLQKKPHATYLITMVAGYLDKLEGSHPRVPLAFYTQPSQREHAANSFRDTAEIMTFYEKEIGVPFPWDKYYQVTVSDFMFGGMENTSMTTLARRTIHSAANENAQQLRVRRLDAHELAHQWFGDYVTCKDWSQLWLNEGFATYYSHLYEGHKFGRDALLYEMYLDAKDRVLIHHKDRRPIVYNRFRTPIEQFDFRAYPKGSWVLHMLRSQLGEQLFRDCVRAYLEKHALASVTTPDLLQAFEAVSGRSFDQFFDQWVYHAGHPSLQVKYQWLPEKKLAKVSVEQTQAVNDDVLLFEFPSALRFLVDGRAIDHEIRVDQQHQDFYVALPGKPTVVRFDPEYTLLADVEFKKSDKLLLAQLKNEQDMIGRLQALQQLAKRKTLKGIEAVGESLRNDPFFGVRVEAAVALGGIDRQEACDQLEQSLAADDARVRLAVVEALGKRFSPQAQRLLLGVFEREQNPTIIAAATVALGKYRDADARRVLLAQLQSESFHNKRAVAAISALGKQRDPALRQAIMQVLQQREASFLTRDFGESLKLLAAACHDLGDSPEDDGPSKGAVERFFRGFLQHPKTSVRLAAIESLGNLADSRSRAVLEPWADAQSSDPVAQAAARALQQINQAAPLVPEELKELRKLVDELRKEGRKLRQEVDEIKSQQKAQPKQSS